ncbi:hypothetical protein VIOR3934_15331 [Vibrio orientalis CIP 102891 = ATCC 33934]|uniref:Uncharacterized protein n=1 Tax=Vibrio orientalis CIP 102891 = ATCC 33934 TaxID=675816 RepID=C9QE09_VIBOR|nr:hypothetical protein VIA_001307 [Vibrio orientalis CIP 102891 = ATCC 33934]EGU44536.1 hypothetical protein VIOR3934_15331 [Vibrio orientalis CIP 102891 = ATCC 33934]
MRANVHNICSGAEISGSLISQASLLLEEIDTTLAIAQVISANVV